VYNQGLLGDPEIPAYKQSLQMGAAEHKSCQSVNQMNQGSDSGTLQSGESAFRQQIIRSDKFQTRDAGKMPFIHSDKSYLMFKTDRSDKNIFHADILIAENQFRRQTCGASVSSVREGQYGHNIRKRLFANFRFPGTGNTEKQFVNCDYRNMALVKSDRLLDKRRARFPAFEISDEHVRI
jgi:hypothetical protein